MKKILVFAIGVGVMCVFDHIPLPKTQQKTVIFIVSNEWMSESLTQREMYKPLIDRGYHVVPVVHYNCKELHKIVNSVQWRIDYIRQTTPGKIYIMGISSGGHLALLTGRKLDGIITYAPVTNLQKYLGRFIDTDKPNLFRTQKLSPVNYEDVMPPTLIVHGLDDKAVAVEDSEIYADKKSCDLVELPGENHTFRPADIYPIIFRWLDEH